MRRSKRSPIRLGRAHWASLASAALCLTVTVIAVALAQLTWTSSSSNAALAADPSDDPEFTITISQSTDFPTDDPTDPPWDDPTTEPPDETLDPVPSETETTDDPGGGDPGEPVSEKGNYPTVEPGNTSCSTTFTTTAAVDLNTRSYQVTWKGTSSGGVAAWRLEFYTGSLPLDPTIGTEKWQRADSSGDTNPNENYGVQAADVRPDGKLSYRMCLRNLGASNLTGSWDLLTTSTPK